MPWLDILWSHEPGGNVEHIRQNAVTEDEVREVLENPAIYDTSDSSGRPLVMGYTRAHRWLVVIYEQIDESTVYPITAYSPKE